MEDEPFRIIALDPNDPFRTLMQILAALSDEDIPEGNSVDVAIHRADFTAIRAYQSLQTDLQGVIDTTHHLLKLIELHPDLSKSVSLAALDPAQLRAFLRQIFDAYETVLSVVNPSGDPRIAEEQVHVLAQVREDRERILG